MVNIAGFPIAIALAGSQPYCLLLYDKIYPNNGITPLIRIIGSFCNCTDNVTFKNGTDFLGEVGVNTPHFTQKIGLLY